MNKHTFTGTGILLRLILRRDRFRLPIWIVSIVGLVLLSAMSFIDLYPTQADRDARAALVDNPAFIALTGPGYGVDDYTFGAMLSQEMILWTVIPLAFMSMMLVIRHTRSEEESGRLEMIRSSAIGRHAPLASTLITVIGANVSIGALIAVGLMVNSEYSISGSLSFGLSVISVGIVFTGISIAAAQIFESSRGVIGTGSALLGLAVGLRAVGDIGNNALVWFSPIGWAQATRPFVEERWWPLYLSLVLTALLILIAMRIVSKRDIGAGMIRPKSGSPKASTTLLRPAGLAMHLQRGSFIAWGSSLFLFGLLVGSLGSEVTTFFEANPQLAEMFSQVEGASPVDSLLSMYIMILAMCSIGYAIQAATQMRKEENLGRAESLLASPISRWRWNWNYLFVAILGSVSILALGGLGAGLSRFVGTGEFVELLRMLGATLVYIPAVGVFIGLAVALFGLLPRVVSLVWLALTFVLVVGMLGSLLQLPAWLNDLSPIAHTPMLPGEEFGIGSLLVLTAIAAALMLIGFAFFRRRDLKL